jgi:uncharacterized protein (TIGR02646 family)
MPFHRRAEPKFWAAKEEQWLALAPSFRERDPLNRREHDKRTLGTWFRSLVRAEGEPRLCAYCDGSLTEQSRETIDHFLPRHEFPELTLSWWNLFPACDRCNSEYKRTRWSCRLVRPDTDPVDTYFDLDQGTGRLRPNPALDWPTRVNIRLTIRVLRLNDAHRCNSRARMVRNLHNAWKHDRSMVDEYAERGPYRFVACRVREAMPASARDPIPPSR